MPEADLGQAAVAGPAEAGDVEGPVDGALDPGADNVLAESLNATLKRETLQGRKGWSTEREARLELFRRLHCYDTVQRHSSLGHRSPIAYGPALDRPHRNTVERCFNRLKQYRGIATRYDQTRESYQAAVTLASTLLWINL